jgi:hypothetical protein
MEGQTIPLRTDDPSAISSSMLRGANRNNVELACRIFIEMIETKSGDFTRMLFRRNTVRIKDLVSSRYSHDKDQIGTLKKKVEQSLQNRVLTK